MSSEGRAWAAESAARETAPDVIFGLLVGSQDGIERSVRGCRVLRHLALQVADLP